MERWIITVLAAFGISAALASNAFQGKRQQGVCATSAFTAMATALIVGQT